MNRLYLSVMLCWFLIGLATSVFIWGNAAQGGDHFVVARFLTAAGVMGVGHCCYKVIFDMRRAMPR